MASQTLADLEDQVRQSLGLVAADSPPSDTEIDTWIIYAQIEIASLLVDEALPTLLVKDTLNGGAVDYVAFTGLTGCSAVAWLDVPIRVISVRFKEASDSTALYARRVNPNVMDIIDDDTNSLYDASNSKYYCIRNGRIELSGTAISEAGSLVVQFVKPPQVTRTTKCDLPDFLQPLIIDYAVAEAKKQVEEFQDAMQIKQAYYQKLQAINQRYMMLRR